MQKIFWCLTLIFVLTISFFIRYQNIIPREFIYDEALYSWSAERLTKDLSLVLSEEITEYHPALFPAVLAMGKIFLGLPNVLSTYSLVVVCISLIGILGIFLLGSSYSSYFLGALCAVCLGFDVIYCYGSVYLWNDMPFAVLAIFLLLALKKVHNRDCWINDMSVSIIISLMILTKYTGLLMIPVVSIFYVFLPNPKKIKLKFRKLCVALSIALLTLAILSCINYVNRGKIFPVISAFRSSELTFNVILKLINVYILSYMPNGLWIAFLGGCVYIFYREDFFGKFLIAYLCIGFLSLLTLREHDFRYGLFFIPVIFMIFGLGIENFLRSFFKNKKLLFVAQVCIFLILGGLFLKNTVASKEWFMYKNRSTPNYLQVAKLVREHDTSETIILSQSIRSMRYYTGINFKRFGGRIMQMPGNKEDIDNLLKDIPGHIIMDINSGRCDVNDEGFLHFLKERNFLLKKVVYNRGICKKNLRNCSGVYVVKIFERK